MRPYIFWLLVLSLILGIRSATAGECLIMGPPAMLDSDSVYWELGIASGQSCVRGLRSRAMTLKRVAIGSPAKFGEATVHGYGFSYHAPTDFKGEDLFSVIMDGANRGVAGASTIWVRVSVR